MSDHEDTSIDTGFSTPVPELDDHTRHQSPTVARARSRRGTAATVHSIHTRTGLNPHLDLVDAELLRTKARDFGDHEEAIQDDDAAGQSPLIGRYTASRSRRGTVTTIDPRSGSPPNSVKAFADARRRERERELPGGDENELHRTISGASARSYRSRRSRLTRQRTNDHDSDSIASSKNSVEDDVCFPFDVTANNNGLQIDFEGLEDFIADEEEREEREKTPAKIQPQRVFTDLRTPKPENVPVFTSDGDYLSTGSSLPLKDEKATEERHEAVKPASRFNKFEFFSSTGETTIHAAEFGDLILPGEDIRSLFTLPGKTDGEEEDGVWWLNMNSPTEEEIRAICKSFGVHPLTIEDIYTQEAREKIELFPSYYFACFRSFQVVQEEGGSHEYEPYMIYVIVFSEGTLSFSFA
jgi:magnesium transporter